MDEYTIADSSHDGASEREREGSLGRRLRDFGSFMIDGSSPKVKVYLRLINGVTHLGFSLVLLAIMAEFMVRYRGKARWWVLNQLILFGPSAHHIVQYILY